MSPVSFNIGHRLAVEVSAAMYLATQEGGLIITNATLDPIRANARRLKAQAERPVGRTSQPVPAPAVLQVEQCDTIDKLWRKGRTRKILKANQ